MDAWIGQQLGAYEIQERLGAGGMGVVYRAVHRRLGQARAIKVLPAMLAHDETFLTRFEREAKLASDLRHPNIVMIIDIAEERGVNYIVMELLEGRSLHEVIRKDGPLPLDRAIRLLAQLGDALDFAHQHGVVHRDIKPGNALVRADDHLTLFDFGIARAAEGARLTEANMRIGTAEYMAPETITIGESGPGTDLYALGIIGYEMLTGRVPFTGVNSQTIMYAQIHSLPAPPRTLRGDLPPQVEAVILRQLDKIPEQRYRTATEYVRALETARDGRLPDTGVSGPGRTSLLGDPPATANPSPRLPTGLWTGWYLGIFGLVVNKDDGTGEAMAFAEAAGIPVLGAIPADDDIRRKSANYQIIGMPGGRWAPLFDELARNVAVAPPRHPTPLSGDGLLGLFKGEQVGRDIKLEPATQVDMCGHDAVKKPSLEVVYDTV